MVPPPAARPPRPPQDAVRAPRAPTALPDTPTARWCRVGRDTASGPLASHHPSVTHRVPPGATHEGHPIRRPARVATPRSSTEGLCQARCVGGTTRAGGTGTPHGRRATTALRPGQARVLRDGEPGSTRPQTGPRRTPLALPARGVEAHTPRHGAPARAGGAPSRIGWCAHAWRDALPGGAESPGLRGFLLVFPPAPLAPNAGRQAPPIAEAQRRLLAVACTPGLGRVWVSL